MANCHSSHSIGDPAQDNGLSTVEIRSTHQLRRLLQDLEGLPVKPPSIYLHASGVGQDQLINLQFLVPPKNTLYVVHMRCLGATVRSTVSDNGGSLRLILESKAIPKVGFDISPRSPSNLSPGGTDMDHRGHEDEVDVDGHNNDDDNDGDDERERRFHEWMNESEDISMSQPTGTRLQDLGNEDDGQTDSHQRSICPDADNNDNIHPRQTPDASSSSNPLSSASVPASEDQREHDALYSPGLMRLREALEAKYNLDNISHVSYALAVDVNCTAANKYPDAEGRPGPPVCLLADRNRVAGEFYGSNYTYSSIIIRSALRFLF